MSRHLWETRWVSVSEQDSTLFSSGTGLSSVQLHKLQEGWGLSSFWTFLDLTSFFFWLGLSRYRLPYHFSCWGTSPKNLIGTHLVHGNSYLELQMLAKCSLTAVSLGVTLPSLHGKMTSSSLLLLVYTEVRIPRWSQPCAGQVRWWRSPLEQIAGVTTHPS